MSSNKMPFAEPIIKASILTESAIRYRSILHGLDSGRINIYRIYYSKLFSFLSNTCLFIFFILPFLERPSSLTASSDVRSPVHRFVFPCGVLEGFDLLCLLFFLVRSLMLTYLYWKEEFFRNKWLIGQFFVLLISFVDLFVSMLLGCSEFYRIRRFFRPYFLISNSQMLKKTIKCLWNTLPELTSFLLLLILWILFSTLAAMCFFSGPLSQKTTSLPDSKFSEGNGVRVKWLYETFFNLIVLLTTANHPDVILQKYNENRATAFFDIVFLAVGTYIFMNIFTAIMYNQFHGYLVSSFQKRLFRRRVAIRAAFEVLKSGDPVPVVDVDKLLQLLEKTSMPNWKKIAISSTFMQNYGGRSLNMAEFMDVFRLLDLSSQPKKPVIVRRVENPMASRIQAFFLSNMCRKVELFVAFTNVFCIIWVALKDESSSDFTFFMINICFAIIYMIEIGIHLWVHGFRNFIEKPRFLCDIILSTINLILRFTELGLLIRGSSYLGLLASSAYRISQWANLSVILRTLVFMQISDLMTTVLFKMPQHLAPVLGVLTAFYYVYALLGLTLFHGAISPPVNGTNVSYICGTYQQLGYWSINFDDFAASIFTLWSLMVLNNWHVIVRAFTEKLGRWVHIYMLSWWLIAAVVLLTLITAMIIESFLFARQSLIGKMVESRSHSRYRCSNTCCFSTGVISNQLGNNDVEPLVIDDVATEEEIQVSRSSEVLQNEIQVISLEDTGMHPPRSTSTSYSFTQIFGGTFTEPTMEELEHHLIRHVEIGPSILSQ